MKRTTQLGMAAAGLGLATVAYFAAAPVTALTATANLSVTATVSNNCAISTAAVAFGAYDPIVTHAATPLDATGTVTITCTQGTSRTVGLNLGSNATGSTRRMVSGGTNYLTYELYKEAGRTNIWGNSGADLVTPATDPAASNAPVDLTVYGRVPAAQNVVAGNYADTVVATVTF